MWSEIIKNSRQLFALIFLLFFFTIDPLFGQQQNQLLTSQTQSKPNIIYQGADGQMVNGIRCATRPSSLEERLRLQEGARSWIERFGPVNRQSIVIIPVAFHIITDADGVTGDVTDQQIMAQVDTLNSGFVSSNFQFSLFSIDRTANANWYNDNDEVGYKTALAVNLTTTLNIYTNNPPNNILGYSYLPSGLPENDILHGVVVLYSTLPGGTATPFDEGDTGTHEVGHYLGLLHTFDPEPNGCNVPGDIIDDTPDEETAATGCPSGRDTCPTVGVDPIHNFMDYVDDACMYEFTPGQSQRMDEQVAMFKPALLQGASAQLTLAENGGGQATDAFDGSGSVSSVQLFRFSLTASGEAANIGSSLTFGIATTGIVAGDFANLQLIQDTNNNGGVDTGENPVGSIENPLDISNGITFSSFTVPVGTMGYIFTGDVNNLVEGDQLTVSLPVGNITNVTGDPSGDPITPTGSVSSATHIETQTIDALVWNPTGATAAQMVVNRAVKVRGKPISRIETQKSIQLALASTTEIAAALDALGISNMTVTSLTTVNLPDFTYLFAVLGQYPGNFVIPANSADATAIENFIAAGGNIYLEGGEVWFWDPPNRSGHDFGPTFGINAVADGALGGELNRILGSDFAQSQDFDYNVGTDNYPDHIDPTDTGFLIQSNNTPAFNCGIANILVQGEASKTGSRLVNSANSRTIGTSFEFGQLVDGVSPATRTELMQTYIEFFDGGGIVQDLTLAENGGGQATDTFTSSASVSSAQLFRFSLTASGEAANIGSSLTLGITTTGIVTGDFANLQLVQDTNNNGGVDTGENAVGTLENPLDINNGITFSSFTVPLGTMGYIFTGDVNNLTAGDQLTVSLPVGNITNVTGATSGQPIIPTGSVSSATHLVDGFTPQGSPNVTFLDNVNDYPSVGYNDCWGYTAPDGREYALLGVQNGTSIIDITDSGNAAEVVFISSPTSIWKDIKTFQNFAYVVNETSGGMQIIDLSNLPNSATLVGTYTGISTSHNIYIDEANAILYAEGSASEPVRTISLANPINPVQISQFGIECHDIYARDGIVYVSEGTLGSIGIFDLAVPATPVFVERIQIPNAGYVHNAWLSDDGNFLMTTEETQGKTVKLFDIQDLGNASITDEYLGPGNLAHNAHIKGNFAYISHYADGLRIVDITDPNNIFEAGFFDTSPSGGGFNGAWGAFPFFPSGKILISDIQSGLYVVSFDPGSPPSPLVFRVERSTGDVFAQGSFIPSGADLAERINVSEPVEAGDIVELDPTVPGYYRKARGNSQLIAGIITTDPGFILGNNPVEMDAASASVEVKTSKIKISSRPMLVLMGRVPVKATTENGQIHPGDLLTISNKPGFAMRCAEAKECEGVIIGKALEGLESGEGLILVLVMAH
ncbi:choice-of-anchor B family protein [candidate division KSB1 bacterium]|nr:choice-of-anchor B family protein [candidate division KSB1 bacterium]